MIFQFMTFNDKITLLLQKSYIITLQNSISVSINDLKSNLYFFNWFTYLQCYSHIHLKIITCLIMEAFIIRIQYVYPNFHYLLNLLNLPFLKLLYSQNRYLILSGTNIFSTDVQSVRSNFFDLQGKLWLICLKKLEMRMALKSQKRTVSK